MPRPLLRANGPVGVKSGTGGEEEVITGPAPEGTKRCSKCHRIKRLGLFYGQKDARLGVTSECRRCHLNRSARTKIRLRDGHAALISFLKTAPCAECGEWFPAIAMDFDHVSGKKFREISGLVRKFAEETVLAEIAKCEVVCANCHRIRSASRAGNVHPLLTVHPLQEPPARVELAPHDYESCALPLELRGPVASAPYVEVEATTTSA